jgi:peptidoglycan/LPS O-acetylase OafA/YrhL
MVKDVFWVPDVSNLIITAILIIILDTTTLVQKMFSNPLLMYLGRISLPLYLIHDFVLHSLSDDLVNTYAGNNSNRNSVVMGVTLFVVIIFSEILTVFVDAPSVQFGNWLVELGDSKSVSFKAIFKWILRLPCNFIAFFFSCFRKCYKNFKFFFSLFIVNNDWLKIYSNSKISTLLKR